VNFDVLNNGLFEAALLDLNFVDAHRQLGEGICADIAGGRSVLRVGAGVDGSYAGAGDGRAGRIRNGANDAARVLLRVRGEGNRQHENERANEQVKWSRQL